MNRDYYKQCKICNKEFTNPTDFHRHLKGHSIKVDAYLLKYELDGINPTCKCGCGSPTNFDAKKGELERGYFRDYVNGHYGKHVQSKEKVVKPPKFKYEPFECKLCSHTSHKPVDFKKLLLEEHDLDIETYTFQYTCEGVQPLCKCGCGEPVRFSFENSLRFNNYYEEYLRHHRPKPKEDKEHVAMRMEATRKAMVEKYGVDNPFKLKSTPDKIKQTKLVKYGDANCETLN